MTNSHQIGLYTVGERQEGLRRRLRGRRRVGLTRRRRRRRHHRRRRRRCTRLPAEAQAH